MAKVSIQFARFEFPTSLLKSLVMMLPTVVRKESPCRRKYSSRARVHKVTPPPEAKSKASAILPLLKQSSTAAVRLPTRRDCLMRASGPEDQSVVLDKALVDKPRASSFFFCSSRSSSSFFFCSVEAESSSKKLSAWVRSNSGPRDGAGCEAATACSSSCWPMSVMPGFAPMNRSASCKILSWSKPRRVGTLVRPSSSARVAISSHIRPSWDATPPH
mmetsp:Transcript_26934/g.50617  ORF Transcript_26934/g.50617 Transcript_26934/m.50617 type:complete len:217 (+) Transcript_26934:631-1281(+)